MRPRAKELESEPSSGNTPLIKNNPWSPPHLRTKRDAGLRKQSSGLALELPTHGYRVAPRTLPNQEFKCGLDGVRSLESTPRSEPLPEIELPSGSDSEAEVSIWTDGSCPKNPGPGGYSAILEWKNGHRKGISGGVGNQTTNNQMELRAILEGLLTLSVPSQVTIYTDSGLCVGWLARGWRRNDSQCAALISEIENVTAQGGHEVRYVQVKGHTGLPLNEECDRLAREAVPA